jgi:hypothetical protein
VSRSTSTDVLRTDGFVSVAAGIKQGELLTNPFLFEGGRLVVNYSTSAAGSLAVEIQDPGGTPIPGFNLADCETAVGDTTAGGVSWHGDPDLEAWAGKPVRLRSVMTECDVYSFKFEPKPRINRRDTIIRGLGVDA